MKVANNLFLGFWTGGRIKGFSQGQYMAAYGGLGTTDLDSIGLALNDDAGAAQAVFSFLLSYAFA